MVKGAVGECVRRPFLCVFLFDWAGWFSWLWDGRRQKKQQNGVVLWIQRRQNDDHKHHFMRPWYRQTWWSDWIGRERGVAAGVWDRICRAWARELSPEPVNLYCGLIYSLGDSSGSVSTQQSNWFENTLVDASGRNAAERSHSGEGALAELPRARGSRPNKSLVLMKFFFFIFFDLRQPQVDPTTTCDRSVSHFFYFFRLGRK